MHCHKLLVIHKTYFFFGKNNFLSFSFLRTLCYHHKFQWNLANFSSSEQCTRRWHHSGRESQRSGREKHTNWIVPRRAKMAHWQANCLIGVLKQVGTTRLLSILVFKNHSAWVKKKLILITISKCPRYLTYTLYTSLMNDKTLVHPHDNTLVHMHEGNSSSHARRNSNPPTRPDRTLIHPHDWTGL